MLAISPSDLSKYKRSPPQRNLIIGRLRTILAIPPDIDPADWATYLQSKKSRTEDVVGRNPAIVLGIPMQQSENEQLRNYAGNYFEFGYTSQNTPAVMRRWISIREEVSPNGSPVFVIRRSTKRLTHNADMTYAGRAYWCDKMLYCVYAHGDWPVELMLTICVMPPDAPTIVRKRDILGLETFVSLPNSHGERLPGSGRVLWRPIPEDRDEAWIRSQIGELQPREPEYREIRNIISNRIAAGDFILRPLPIQVLPRRAAIATSSPGKTLPRSRSNGGKGSRRVRK